MATIRWSDDPVSFRAVKLQVENLAIVPASLLPYKARYQRLANQLPPGVVLVVLPAEAGPEREALQCTADRLLAKGHPVTTLSADEVLGRPRRKPDQRTASSPPVEPPPTGAASEPAPSVPVPAAAALVSNEVPAFTQELRLVQVDASQEPARFWVLQWQPMLFAGMALVAIQGRLGHPARAKVLLHADQAQLTTTIEQAVRRRLQQGYQLVDWV